MKRTLRECGKEFGSFSELTREENKIIHKARIEGFASFYPAYPSAESQARDTLKGAKEFLRDKV